VLSSGTSSTGTVATGVVSTGTISTGIVISGTVTTSEIAGLLKTLDSNTLMTLASFKSAYDLEYARLSTTATDAASKGLLGMVLCFTSNPKSPDQLKTELKNLYDTSTKSLVEKSALLAGQLTSLDKQLQYGTLNTASVSLALV
ncbi:MAG: hypothetical protein RL023_485, partial [Candidatus Parcubacteria bacterium]